MSENCGGLIIDLEELARIRAACERRAAELAVPGSAQRASDAAASLPPIPATRLGGTEAERFAAAVQTMPARVQAFFEREDSPQVPVNRRESAEDQEQRLFREGFGGWCG